MAGSLVVSSAPALEPVTLYHVKKHLKIEDELGALDDEDELLQEVYIAAARADVEYVTHRALITQTLVYRCRQFPITGPLRLQRPPLQSVTSVQYVDGAGTTQTWDSSEYVVDTYSTPGAIEPAYGYSWPTSRGDRNSVIVTYVAGYGAGPSSIPPEVRRALLLLVGDSYAQREDTQILGSGERELEQLPKPAQRILQPLVVPIFG